jgi:hypothetical protein
MSMACSTYGEKGKSYRVLVKKKTLGRSRRRWQNNNKVGIKEIEREGVDDLARQRRK